MRLGFIISHGEDWDDASQLASWIIGVFRSILPMLSEVRLVHLIFHRNFLQRTMRVCPDLTQLPTFDGRIVYRWSCYTSDLNTQTAESERCMYAYLDPVTLQPTGMLIISMRASPD